MIEFNSLIKSEYKYEYKYKYKYKYQDGMEFKHEADFDENGILYYLGTFGKTRPFRNPGLYFWK